ncbi:MAG: hypothetical protein GTO45_16615 [Candidatus Aminicenantes bacterium]|nr:hypothetical protein [Candidatus Aminicenantes bacterium]NIM80364.1 hypothetical protein [Candidatus Aminicenantes bacterium]NIN19751.1 hypothetical protein [Candidatus Aminicenantes bacterium]NIN43633.1 hypothetical protein [Candidatus Aminicenantes bacterium]NIN86378.1 hypothetical protein [Candidatus Aminicenantes bacterium]
MAKKKRSIAEKMGSTRVLLENVVADDIKSVLLNFGYDDASFDFGKQLFTTGDSLIQKRKELFGDQLIATRKLNAKEKEAYNYYMDNVKLSKVALTGFDGMMAKLGILGDRDDSFEGWVSQARQYYKNAQNDPNILQKLTKVGLTLEKLQAGDQLLDQLEKLKSEREDAKGKAQTATKDRDKALDDLFAWASALKQVCRVAFKDNLQILERLGILVPS